MKQSAASFLIVRNFNNGKVKITFVNSEKLQILKKEVIKKYLTELVSRPGILLEIDLSEVKFIDSECFDILNLLARISKKYNSRVILNSVGNELLDLIRLVKEHSVFDIQEINPKVSFTFNPNIYWLN